MKRNVVLVAVFVTSMFIAGGCKSEDNPVGEGTIEGNLFPLAQGRIWVSDAYELDTLGQRIQNSKHRETLYASGTTTIGGKTAFIMVDSVYSSTGPLNFVDTTYMATENGDFFLYFGSWITIFKQSEGLNKEYVGGNITITDFGIPLNATVRCKINPKESVTVPKGTVQAYKVEVKASLSFGGLSIDELQYIWFADELGPVKIQFPPTADPLTGQKSRGSESLLVSTNF
ncbi:MAG TPA: hypothetical protein VII11_00695 [Bacteroidota bacterium]